MAQGPWTRATLGVLAAARRAFFEAAPAQGPAPQPIVQPIVHR